jgi:hypothetical protein
MIQGLGHFQENRVQVPQVDNHACFRVYSAFDVSLEYIVVAVPMLGIVAAV